MFARQTGQRLTYEAILVEEGDFPSAVEGFFAKGGKGLNVTVPFKEQACQIAATLSERAGKAHAVNTLYLHGGSLAGDNTDGVGLVRDLTVNHGLAISGQSILLLGAGGAARGVMAPLLDARPAHMFIANRTAGKATALAAEFAGTVPVTGGGLEEIPDTTFDLIINATAAGLANQVPALPEAAIAPTSTCYDMMYSDSATAFQQYARSRHAAHALDGLGMLVEQAAESFRIWRDVRPDTAAVIKALRQQ